MDGAAANLGSEAAKGIFQEVKRHVRYVINHKKNVEKFEEKMKSLIAKRKSLQQEVDAAERNVETVKEDVKLWCQQADKKIDEEGIKVKDLQDKAEAKCFIGLCPNIKSRYKLSRKAEEAVAAFDKLIQEGQFNKVAFRDVPPAITISAAPKNFKAFDSRKEVLEEIMDALRGSTMSVIGVYGVGGVGKTTLVNEVARQAAEVKLFTTVVKVEVNRTPNIEKIQDQIAESLGLKLEESSKKNRANRLLQRLKKEKKVLIVLDDIWAGLDLEEVGIPFGDRQKGRLDMEKVGTPFGDQQKGEGLGMEKLGDQHNECKILLTSRNRDVLKDEMDAEKTFPVGVVEEEEAWELFKEMAGNGFENPELKSVATEVAKRCAGLPLAIATVARALKNKGLREWKDACLQLQWPSPENFTGIPKAVYSAIELSYNCLAGDKLPQTFLLSCLLGNGAHIQDLVRCAMGLRLFDNVSTVEETRNRVLTMVSYLKASCLLLDDSNEDSITMHDFVCDVGLAIASRDNHAFVWKHGKGLEDWPDEDRMKEFKWISLSFASINKLSHDLECPQLSLFSMGTATQDSNVEMPPSFFGKLKKIKVLNLTEMDFSSSISLPTSLRTLCLEKCKLGDSIINLGKLENLEILSLSGSAIEMLPKEIGQLKMLRLLDLSYCSNLRIISPGLLLSLSRLEELYMTGIVVPWNQQNNARLDELKELSCLTTVDICIIEANIVPTGLFTEKLLTYKILIGDKWDWKDKVEYSKTLKLRVDTSIDHLDQGFKRILKKAEALYLENLEGVSIVLNQVGNRGCFLNLKHVHVRNASEIQYIMKDYEAAHKIAFCELRSLTLEKLSQLISFCSSRNRTEPKDSNSIPQHDELPLFGEQMELPCLENLCLSSINVGRIWHSQFSTLDNLKSLTIQGCGNLKHILSSSMAKRLVHLKSFEIVDCKSLREIIFTEDIQEEEENNVTISFPELSTLKMKNLPHLIGYCSENYNIDFPLLWELDIEQCPEFNGFVYKSTTEENQPQFMQAVFDEKVVCPNLVNLRLFSIKVERIWHDQLPNMSCYVQKLGRLSVKGCHNLKCIFSSSMMPLLMELHTILIEDCANIEIIFIEEEAAEEYTILPKLNCLSVKNLPKLMTFCHGSYLEFPSLKSLHIQICPTFRTFIFDSRNAQGNSSSDIDFPPLFNEKVVFPQLEYLMIVFLENCRKIWHNLLAGDSFSKLNILFVFDCHRLLNIFPVNLSKRLQNLQELMICGGDSLEEIFESKVLDANEIDASVTATQSIVEQTITNFIFPKLTCLELSRLPKLQSFYPRIHATEWPSLKKMWLYACNMVEIFASDSPSFGKSTNLQPLFWVNEVTFPNLEELKLEWNDVLRTIWHGKLRADVFIKLRVLELIRFPDTVTFFQHRFIQSLPNLEKLVVSDAAFSQLFNLEGIDGNERDTVALTSLNELRLDELPQLTHLLKEDYILSGAFRKVGYRGLEHLKLFDSSEIVEIWKRNPQGMLDFKSLKSLEVYDCSSLKFLFTISMALDLAQLGEIKAKNCTVIEHIIVDEGADEEEMKNKIVFPLLLSIILESCGDLATFYQGSKILEFPSLKQLEVVDCPQMFAFASTFSREQRIELITEGGNKTRFSNGGKDVFAAAFFNSTVVCTDLEDLQLSSINVQRIWDDQLPETSCYVQNLTSLTVKHCHNLRCLFSFSMKQLCSQLTDLLIEDCTSVEEVISIEERPAEEDMS